MTPEESTNNDPFTEGPHAWFIRAVRAERFLPHHVWRRALTTALVLWVPLAVLTALQQLFWTTNPRGSFLFDPVPLTRYLIAAPLFVLAEKVYVPQLAWTVQQFAAARLIPRADLPRYDALVASTRRLVGSRSASITVMALAYIVAIATSPLLSSVPAPAWVTPAWAGVSRMSLAGWWRMLVSQPLFVSLNAVWLWRLIVWVWFLARVSRMNLRLVASHPDRAGGLRFVTLPVRGFAILAFALGAVAAGTVGPSIVFDGRPLTDYQFIIGVQIVTVLVLFAAPVLLMTIPLLELQDRGTIQYGQVASQLGREFERRWFDAEHKVEKEALGAPDFSATTDLYSVAANVRAINPVILDLRLLAMLVGATLLPYVPVILVLMPLHEVVQLVLRAFL